MEIIDNELEVLLGYSYYNRSLLNATKTLIKAINIINDMILDGLQANKYYF